MSESIEESGELLHRIALRDSGSMRRDAKRALLVRHGSARRALRALGERVELEPARRELDEARRLGLQVLVPEDPSFPRGLCEIPDAPLMLYVRGRLPRPDASCIAIVGSRKPSARARSVAERFARELAAAGAPIISGLAYGIDAAAHEGALAAGGQTIAVLASGPDAATPSGNAGLARRILERGGAWISEYPPGTQARPFRFPERNRLISGMSRATLVVEARLRSGSLWTARHALEQGRDVISVPGPIDTELCRGSNGLLRDGATLVLDAADLLYAALGIERRPEGSPKQDAGTATRHAALSPEAQGLIRLLADGPVDLDELGRSADLAASRLAGLLLELELARLVERCGRRVALC